MYLVVHNFLKKHNLLPKNFKAEFKNFFNRDHLSFYKAFILVLLEKWKWMKWKKVSRLWNIKFNDDVNFDSNVDNLFDKNDFLLLNHFATKLFSTGMPVRPMLFLSLRTKTNNWRFWKPLSFVRVISSTDEAFTPEAYVDMLDYSKYYGY